MSGRDHASGAGERSSVLVSPLLRDRGQERRLDIRRIVDPRRDAVLKKIDQELLLAALGRQELLRQVRSALNVSEAKD